MAHQPGQRPSDARERARQIAQQQSKRSATASRRWIQVSVIAVVLVIIAIVAVVYTQTKSQDVPDAGSVPASSNSYGGIVITKDGIKKNTSSVATRDVNDLETSTVSASATASGGTSTTVPPGLESPEQAKKNGQPVHVTIFQDYNCIHCAEFESQYGDAIKKKVLSGEIVLEVRNLNFLDAETSTEYSSRAAVAAYAVAEQVTPEQFLSWQQEMFSHQGQGGLTNKQLEEIASSHGADITSAMDSNAYRPMVNYTVALAQANGITGTPTVFADSQPLQQSDFTSFLSAVEKAKKES